MVRVILAHGVEGQAATKMNIILMKAEVLKLRKAGAVCESSTGLGKATPTEYHGKPLMTSILLVSIMEHMLKSACSTAREREDRKLQKEVKYLIMACQLNRKTIGNISCHVGQA